jgi:hypothetical protein
MQRVVELAGYAGHSGHDCQGEPHGPRGVATSDLGAFVTEVTAECRNILVGPHSPVVRGKMRWGQFEAAVVAYCEMSITSLGQRAL